MCRPPRPLPPRKVPFFIILVGFIPSSQGIDPVRVRLGSTRTTRGRPASETSSSNCSSPIAFGPATDGRSSRCRATGRVSSGPSVGYPLLVLFEQPIPADQVYGDEEMHGEVRRLCMDYMVRVPLNFIRNSRFRRGIETTLRSL